MKIINRVCLLVGLLLSSLLSSVVQAEPLKVGFVYVSPRADAGWTYMHDYARQQLEEYFGDQIETTFVESVAEGADAERVIRNMASRGHGLIFTTSFGYMNPTIKIAQQFPEVKFEHATGYRLSDNVGVYLGREYQGRYLNGIAAGAVSETGNLGFVGAFPIPEVIRDINAFALGARVSNPEATVRVVWTNSWHDPAREREATETLVLQGVDVVANHTDSAAVVQTAETLGIYSVGFNSDLQSYGPNTQISSTVFNWFPLYRDKVQAVLDGTWESEWSFHGLAEDVIQVTPILLPEIPEQVSELVQEHYQQIASGERDVFDGPLLDQDAMLRLQSGEKTSDKMLHEMDWFVQGVSGQIPGQ